MMKFISMLCLIGLLVGMGPLGAEQVVLPEVLNPNALAVHADYLYVMEETSILVFKLPDYQFVKRFGKSGEGPMEFSRFVTLTPLRDRLWINSMGKISVFSLKGDFMEVKKSPGQFRTLVLPLGDKHIGRLMQRGDEGMSSSLVLFDAGMNKLKELAPLPFGGGPGGGGPGGRGGRPGAGASLVFPMTPSLMAGNGQTAAVAAWDTFRILLVADGGKSVKTVEKTGFQRPSLGQSDKKAYEESLKRRFGTRWPQMKERISFGEFYPALGELFFDGSDLIATTWKMEKTLTQVYRFAPDGRELGVLLLPLRNQAPLERFPLTVGNGRVYQLVENEDEEWELVVTELK
jgi:hypothetical protein